MRLRNVLAVTRKEARTMRHDRGLLGAILVQPVVYLILFGLAVTNEVNHAPWIVYDQSQTATSRQFIADLTSSDALGKTLLLKHCLRVRTRLKSHADTCMSE